MSAFSSSLPFGGSRLSLNFACEVHVSLGTHIPKQQVQHVEGSSRSPAIQHGPDDVYLVRQGKFFYLRFSSVRREECLGRV